MRRTLDEPESQIVETVHAQEADARDQVSRRLKRPIHDGLTHVERITRHEFRAQRTAPDSRPEVLTKVVPRLIFAVAIRPVSPQIEEAVALLLHEGMNISERRLSSVQLQEFLLHLDAEQTLHLLGRQRRENLDLGSLSIQL